jgi:lipoprotein-anchoring transpeptidase ErfK/SrfK
VRLTVLLSLAGWIAAFPSVADGAFGPPWSDPSDPTFGEGIGSVRVLRADEPLLAAPDAAAARRGSGLLNVRLPYFGARHGPGCDQPWLQVGPRAWACGDHVELAVEPGIAAGDRTDAGASLDGLPFRYYFVGPDGSFGYQELRAADISAPTAQLEPGFAVAVIGEQVLDGYAYGLTNNQLWVPMRDLTPVAASHFTGAELSPGASGISVAWVYAETATVRDKPSPGARVVGKLERFARVDVLAESGTFTTFAQIGDHRWVHARDLRRPTVAPPPDEVDTGAGERWIDIDLDTQTLVAYEGEVPVFATLVSTGKGRQGTANATPKGVHRVWAKLLTSDMDNLEDENANRYYRMEDVPYVQYFSKGVGLHGAFWHRSFGRVRSHGCVNLAPRDAQRLFWWTGLRLPAGWTAVLPTARQPGAVVRVR